MPSITVISSGTREIARFIDISCDAIENFIECSHCNIRRHPHKNGITITRKPGKKEIPFLRKNELSLEIGEHFNNTAKIVRIF